MRTALMIGIAACAVLLGGVAFAAQPALQPEQPASGSSLQIYIKVKNQELVEYCKGERLGVPRCTPGQMYEARDACAPPYKVASVSCGLSDLGAEPRLVVSASDPDQVSGACVWAFEKFPADRAPQATTSLLCIK